MEPENDLPDGPEIAAAPLIETSTPPGPPMPPEPDDYRGLRWVFFGEAGLRAGWSIAIFAALLILFSFIVGSFFFSLHLVGNRGGFSARTSFFNELIPFVGMVGAMWIVALIGRRRIFDFNLTGPHRSVHFLSGLAAGFLALSAEVGGLTWGGWLHFGPSTLNGPAIFNYALGWAVAFLLVGCVEEGVFRCFLQSTLAHSINFWWALSLIALMCLRLVLSTKGNGAWGVYAVALLGLVPCLLLELKKTAGAGFWQAAWVTSTAFGLIHTGNNGENWVGIFAAAAIGFVFCVSIRVTGSAWWAIGCHAGWDWTETYFYGAADSGTVAQGHYLSTSPAGNPLFSGGTDGPEGSLLVIGVILLLLVSLLAIYRHRRSVQTAEVAELPAG